MWSSTGMTSDFAFLAVCDWTYTRLMTRCVNVQSTELPSQSRDSKPASVFSKFQQDELKFLPLCVLVLHVFTCHWWLHFLTLLKLNSLFTTVFYKHVITFKYLLHVHADLMHRLCNLSNQGSDFSTASPVSLKQLINTTEFNQWSN